MNRKILQLDDYNFISYVEKKTLGVEPILELYKGKLYCNIIKYFIDSCIKTFGSKIFSVKKSYQRTLCNILSSWMFSLYSTYDFSDDYFFPSNYKNMKILNEILLDMCKFDPNITSPQQRIDSVLEGLAEFYKNQLLLLKKYNATELYIKNKNNFTIVKYSYEQKRNNVIVLFYKFNINIKYTIRDKRLQNILNNILIPIDLYDSLSKKYTGNKNELDTLVWTIIYRYQLLGSNNHQLAVLPSIMRRLNADYNLNFEFFASTINATFNNYCSIYYDLERYFGSLGSFFDVIPIKGTFGFNPPYQVDIITNGLERLLDIMKNTVDELTFIITIPIWDCEGKEQMSKLYNNELKRQNIDYGEFDIIKKVKLSKYMRECKMISKENFTYIDHNFLLFKNKTIQNTYVIILSNKTHTSTLDKYNFFTHE